MNALYRTFTPDNAAPRAIALRCRKAGDQVAFGKVYLGVPWTSQRSGHVTEFQVYIPHLKGRWRTVLLGENLFHPCNPENWHLFTKRPQGEVEKAVDLDSTCAIARLKRELGDQLKTGRETPAPAPKPQAGLEAHV